MVLSPFLRQMFVVISLQLASISVGASVGFGSILLQQLRSNDSIIRPDLNTSTWIVSMFGMASNLSIFMPLIMQKKGRKIAISISCLLFALGWMLIITAKNTLTLTVAEAILGLGSSCVVIVTLMAGSEMLAPKYRSPAIMSVAVAQSMGMSIGSIISNYIYWKTLALIMMVPVIAAFLMVFIWPESPSWLAYKGLFEECEKSFISLRGDGDEAMKELHDLITAQKRGRKSVQKIRDIVKKFCKKDFYLPNFYILLVFCNYYLSGVFCMYLYTYQILEEGTGSKTAAFYGSLYRDISLVIGSCVTLILVKFFSNKSVLLATTLGSIASIVCCFIVSYLKWVGFWPGSILLVYTFSLYMTFCNSGLNFITFLFASELVPVKHRGLGGALFTIYFSTYIFISSKCFPYMVLCLNLWGTFLLFAFLGVITVTLIWKFVPNTKNRTLQEIEDYYCYGSFVKCNADDVNVRLQIVNDKDY